MARLALTLLIIALSGPAFAQSAFWEPAAGPYGGTVVAAMAKLPDGTVLAGTRNGIFRSTDGGDSWKVFSDGLPGRDVRALLALPEGDVLAGLHGDGIFRLADGASSWTATGLRAVMAACLTADVSGSLWAGTVGGLLRSDDDGVTWREIKYFSKMHGGVVALTANDTYVFAATRTGIFRSSDGGGSWEAASAGLGELQVTAIAAVGGELFAGTSPDTGAGSLYRSRNNGATWTRMQLPTEPLLVKAIASDPDGNLYAGGHRNAYVSADGGESWTHAAASETSLLAFAFSEGTIMAATEGRGIARLTTSDVNWHSANDGLGSTIYDIAATPGGTVYVGTAGGVYRSIDRGTNWTLLDRGLKPLAARTLAIDRQGRPVAGTGGGVLRMDPETETWEPLGPPGNPGIRDLGIGPGGEIYAGYYAGVYRLDRPGVWSRLSIVGADEAERDVVALLVDSTGTLFAGSYYDAYRTTDGVSWQLLDLVPDYESGVQAFVLGPDGAVYAGTRFTGVRRSDNGGASWRGLVGGLVGNEDFYSLAVDGKGTLYAGTYGSGALRYDDGMEQWVDLSRGLGDTRVIALAFDSAGNGYAGTIGGGLFRHLEGSSSDTEPADALPSRFALHGNYPNPFNPSTTLRFDLAAQASISVEVYDLLGRRVMALPEQIVPAGAGRTMELDASGLASGSYLYRVTARSAGTASSRTGRFLLGK